MNKLFTKIGTAMVGIAMAIGVGVAVGKNKAVKVDAADPSYTYAINSKSWATTQTGSTTSITWESLSDFDNKFGNGGCVGSSNSASAVSTGAFTNVKSVSYTGSIVSGGAGTYLVQYSATKNGTYSNISDAKTTATGTFTFASETTCYLKIIVTSTSGTASKWVYLKNFTINCKESTVPSLSFVGPITTVNVGASVTNTAASENIGDNVISYSSNNTDVATVNASTGEVTGVAAGNATITASVTVDEVEYTASYNIKVTAITYRNYVKVTSSEKLVDGNYVIAYEAGNVIFDSSLETLDASSNNQTVAISNSKIKANADYSFTLTKVESNWTIKSSGNKYIGRDGDSNGLTASDSPLSNTISFDEDGNAVIVGSGGAYLRYNSDSGQERFRYFKSSSYTSQKVISLYKEMTAADYAKSFLTAGLNTSKQSCTATKTAWTSLKNEFNDLNDSAKQTLREATHNAPSSYDSSTDLSVAHCVARYDQVIIANGIANYPDFMDRTTQGTLVLLTNNGLAQNSNNEITTIVIIASVLTTLTVAGIFLLKRKEEK